MSSVADSSTHAGPSQEMASSSTHTDTPRQDAAAEATASTSTRQHNLGVPDTNLRFDFKNDLTSYIKRWALSQGFCVSISGSDISTVRFKCEHGGEYRERDKKGIRSGAPTRQKGCPFKMTGKILYWENSKWSIRDVFPFHSHEATSHEEMKKKPQARALAAQSVYPEIIKLSATLPPREVVATLRKSHPDLYILPRDVSNLKVKHKREKKQRKHMTLGQILRELYHASRDWSDNKDNVFHGLVQKMADDTTFEESLSLFFRVFESDIHRIRNPPEFDEPTPATTA